jgi:LysR family transcriptional regulator, regulator of abg operon
MKLSYIQAFVAVIKAGSIHAAARDLDMSQPAVSKSLRALEGELAAPLLIRSINGVEPTDYGKVFYQHAQVIIDELRKAKEDVVQLQGKLEGSLTVAIAPASTMQVAPMVFKDFRLKCPDVKLHIVEGIWPSVAEPLRNGTVDIALSPVLDEISRSELAVEKLLDVQMAVVVRPSHPLVAATSLKELAHGDWLHQGTSSSASVLIRRIFEDQNLPVPTVSVESRSLTATIMMLQAMDLLAVMPRAMLESDAIKGTLVALNLKELFRANQLGLIYREDRPLTRVAQVFATLTRRAAAHLVKVGSVHSNV